MAKVAKTIHALRVQNGMTQEELAQQLFVSRQTVSNYETGKSQPDVEMLVQIAAVLHTDVQTLIYGVPVPPQQRRERRTLLWLAAIAAGLGVALWLAWPVVQSYHRRFYEPAPLLWRQCILLPCFCVVLGCALWQGACLLFDRHPLQGKATRAVYRCLLAAGVLYLLIILPYLLAMAADAVHLATLRRLQQEYNYSYSFSIFPAWDVFALTVMLYAPRCAALFAAYGAALWATRPQRMAAKEAPVQQDTAPQEATQDET